MASVEFEEEHTLAPTYFHPDPNATGIIGFLISHGIAHTTDQAKKILVVVLIILIVLLGIILYINSNSTTTKIVAPPGNSIIQIDNGPPRLAQPAI